MSSSTALLKRMKQLAEEADLSRVCVIDGPVGGDEAAVADAIASGKVDPADLIIYVNRFCDDFTE